MVGSDGALVLMFVLLYYVSSLFELFLFIGYSFWVPQIVSSVRRDAAKPLLPLYVALVSVGRLIPPAFFFLVDPNFAMIEPNPVLVLWLSVWVFAQVLVLLAQHYLGPRFFVPQVLLPTRYDYFRPLPASLTVSAIDCVVRLQIMSDSSAPSL